MSQAQRIIKYFSICVAALLIVGIFSLIFDGFGMKERYQEKGYKNVIFMPFKKNELVETIKNNID